MSRLLVDSITGAPIPLNAEQTAAHTAGQAVALTRDQRGGMAGWPQELNEAQTQARDPAFAAAHPADAAANSYKGPFSGQGTDVYQWGDKLRDKLLSGNKLGDMLNKGVGTGAALGGAAGAGLGALAGGAADLYTGQRGHSARFAAILGLLGAGVGGYSGSLRKTALWSNNDERSQVLDMIGGAPGIGFAQKSKMMAAIPGLSENQCARLYQMLATASGASVGAIAAHFLLNAGFFGTLVGSAIGGGIGHSLFGGSTDAMGYSSMGTPDLDGNY
jgi:hypothetical protein